MDSSVDTAKQRADNGQAGRSIPSGGKKKRKILLVLAGLFIILVILPTAGSFLVFKWYFGHRFESPEIFLRSLGEFDGLIAERHVFPSDRGQMLTGYAYTKSGPARGVIVIAHGFGFGGHNSYMDVADFFAGNGYIVFAYDATACDESEGGVLGGMPQGIIDLDYALRYVKEHEDFGELPLMLFGHSWGAYSSGTVLPLHTEVRAAVLVAGPNSSADIILETGQGMLGPFMYLLMPSIRAIESSRFGEYARLSCLEGFFDSDAALMLIHSRDDDRVAYKNAYQRYYNRFKDDPRFEFISYEERGHSAVFHSDASRAYNEDLNERYSDYLKANGLKPDEAVRVDFIEENADWELMFELDTELLSRMIDFYDRNIR